MIRLFTSAFPEPNPVRAAEYDECLRRNLACEAIGQVCLLIEGESNTPAHFTNATTRRVPGRPRFADYLAWIRELAGPDDVSIIANSDIFFDRQLRVFMTWRIPASVALALSRWDVRVGTSPSLYDHNDSQDVWIFRGIPLNVSGNFAVGVPRCDNRFAHELEDAGYSVINPSMSLRTYHLHSGIRTSYSVANDTGFVPPPYKYVWPHNLWSLPRTLVHNIRHPEARVGWSVDKRKWSAHLRLHVAQRVWRSASRSFGPGAGAW